MDINIVNVIVAILGIIVTSIVTLVAAGKPIPIFTRSPLLEGLPKHIQKIAKDILPFPYSNKICLTFDQKNCINIAGARHVIFRMETINIFIETIDIERLKDIGERIGETAGCDLYKAIKRKDYAENIDCKDLFELCNLWDTNGGWGSFKLKIKDNDEWIIQVQNNFIEPNNVKQNVFWEGYFKGFINKTIIMIDDDNNDDNIIRQRRKGLGNDLPHQLLKVVNVKNINNVNDDNKSIVSTFKIVFGSKERVAV